MMAEMSARRALQELRDRFAEELTLEHWRKERGHVALKFALKWADQALAKSKLVKQCGGELWIEQIAGVLTVSREDESGNKVWQYQCQRCRQITTSSNPKRKRCTMSRED